MDNVRIHFISLGCDKNLVDAESMLGLLSAHGYVFTEDASEADVIVINTCCFIHDAMEESIQTIIDMGACKETGNCKALIVTGCLGTGYTEEMHRELPEVDAILSASAYDQIVSVVEDVLAQKKHDAISDVNALPLPDAKRVLTTGHYAYLKIAEGCDKRCTYCAIPKMRGSYRSIPMERLVAEAQDLVKQGARELILVAQETTLYGRDLYGEKSLCRLLEKLCGIEDLKWIRLLYCYPEEIDDDLIDMIAREEKICHYLDIPIQHASDRILKRMGRRTSQQDIRELIGKLRERIPDICLRTTLISGFPGETDEDHAELLNFVKEMRFDRLGVFTYSRQEGTPAYDFDEQVDENTAGSRRDEIMRLQQEICYDKSLDLVGEKMNVLVEGRLIDEDACLARTYRDAPDVDGCLFIQTDRELISGELVPVIVTGAHEYDLIGELADESAE